MPNNTNHPYRGSSRYSYAARRRKQRLRRRRILICCVAIIILAALVVAGILLFGGSSKDPADSSSNTSSFLESSSLPSSSQTSSEGTSSQESSSEASSSEPEPSTPDTGAEGHWSGNFFVYDGMGFEPFGGSEELSQYYVDALLKFREALPDSVKTYDMVVPTHVEFGLPERYSDVSTDQKPVIDSIYSRLGDGFTCVDAYSILSQKRNEYIYFNTDHHWTGLGAYYGYTKFCEAAGLEPVDINSLEKNSIEGFLGTLYFGTKDSELEANPDTVDYYTIPGEHDVQLWEKGSDTPFEATIYADFASGSNAYSVFVWGDNKLMTIKSPELNNGKKIAVIKESYGNAFCPYLAANYEEVHIIDSRYFGDNAVDYIVENGIQEVIFVNNVMSANVGIRAREIENLITQ